MKSKDVAVFEQMPVHQAIMTLAVPTIISQLITVAYNMADTFFIGQTGDPNQVAAVNLCMPLFFFMTGIANLFGIGGSSLVSRCLGADNRAKARRTAAFSIWTSVGIALFYGILVYAFSPLLLLKLGADDATYEFCRQYIFWTIGLGAVPTVMNAQLAHLVRAEGYAREASFGMAMGALLNVALDPIGIMVLKLGTAGAAMATMISNSVAFVYFVRLIVTNRHKMAVTIDPRYYSLSERIPSEVLLVGMPSALMSLMSTASNIVLNKLLSGYANEALAGVGIAKKIDMLALGVAMGISQGVLPLVGYNYASGNNERMMKVIKTTFMFLLGTSISIMLLLFTCAGPIVSCFISDPLTVQYGREFQRILCVTTPCSAVMLMIITIFQAIGQKTQPTILSFLRKGGLDIPFMIVLNRFVGINGIIWATPISDVCATMISVALFIPFIKKLKTLRTEY